MPDPLRLTEDVEIAAAADLLRFDRTKGFEYYQVGYSRIDPVAVGPVRGAAG